MEKFCRYVAIAFTVAYVIALLLFALGHWGLFGTPRDPLAGVFLIPLGLPWILLAEYVGDDYVLAVGVLMPALNLILLRFLCRLARS
jgi:hypothetical protein